MVWQKSKVQRSDTGKREAKTIRQCEGLLRGYRERRVRERASAIRGDISLPAYKLFGFIRFERLIPGVIALSLNSAAYLSEIIRSGIQSIDHGQTEAARSLGMSQWQNMRYIVLPQAIKNILPAIANEFVTIIKESSICFTIGVQEIMSAVKSSQMAAFAIAEPLLVAAAIYFCLTFPTSKIIEHFERKMSRGDKR